MTRINLKAMYNDPSQMREALAWRLFSLADIPAPRHTYAKLAFGTKYRGLFSVIEHVDKKFLRDHFGGNYRGNLYKTGYRDIGGAYLEYRAAPDGDDSGRQYFIPGSAERTYRLQTNKNNPEASTYDDLACFIRTINGIGLGGGEGRFDTDAFRESVDGIMNVNAFFRWAAVNMLLGSWDNYYASGSNYYLYNSGHPGAAKDFASSPYFHFIPWDYDNCLGIDYSGTQWQYADILDWPGKANRQKPKIPLVRKLLRNHDYRQYYLDYLEPCSIPSSIRRPLPRRSGRALRMACGTGSGRRPTWNRIRPMGARSPASGTATTRSTERLPTARTGAREKDDGRHRPLRPHAS